MGRLIRICDRLAEKAVGNYCGELHVPEVLAGMTDVVSDMIHRRVEMLNGQTTEDSADGRRLGKEQELKFLEMLARRLGDA